MRMNSGIVLGVEQADPMRAILAGTVAGQQMREAQQRNALAAAYARHGAGAMRGDANALAAIAGIDPAAAQGLYTGVEENRRADEGLALRRQDTESAIGARNASTANDARRLQLLEVEAEQQARQASAEERATANAMLVSALPAFEAAQTAQEWDAIARRTDPSMAGQFGQRAEALAIGRGLLRGTQGAGNARASLNPIWGTDAQGNPAVVQLADNGEAIQTQFPEGFSPAKATDRIDAGTEWILLDPVTRQPVGRVPKNNFEAASQTAQGKAVGESIGAAAAGLPTQRENVGRIEAAGAEIMNDPGLEYVLGPFDSRVPRVTQVRADAQAKIDRFVGQTFPMAMESLRGLGPASEMEGIAAQRAIANLDQAQNPEQFKAFLQEAMDHIRRGFEIAEQKAGQAGAAIPQPPSAASAPPQRFRYNPETGEIE